MAANPNDVIPNLVVPQGEGVPQTLIKLPYFDLGQGMVWRDFLQAFNRTAFCNARGDQMKCRKLPAFLKGQAALVWEGLDDAIKTDWQQLKLALTRQ